MKGPLHGLRVADFSQLVQGPSATQLLGDMGADIVKIEPRSGEWSRSWSIGDTFVQKESLSFLAFNRAKRSITLDLKADEGKEVALRIIKSSDVLIENFRPGVMDRLGLGYEILAATQPGLIYCASSGWGQERTLPGPPGPGFIGTVYCWGTDVKWNCQRSTSARRNWPCGSYRRPAHHDRHFDGSF